MPGMDWTGQQIEELRKLWAEGLSTRLIGERMRISKNAVVGKAHRLGLPERPSPVLRGDRSPDGAARHAVLREQALALHRGGMPRAHIAERLGVSANHASNLLRGVGQPKGRRLALAPGLGLPATATAPVPQSAPAVPPMQFRPIEPRCCKWPLWNDKERPTHRYCEGPTITRRDGVPDVYCAAHRAKATARTMFPLLTPRFAA